MSRLRVDPRSQRGTSSRLELTDARGLLDLGQPSGPDDQSNSLTDFESSRELHRREVGEHLERDTRGGAEELRSGIRASRRKASERAKSGFRRRDTSKGEDPVESCSKLKVNTVNVGPHRAECTAPWTS